MRRPLEVDCGASSSPQDAGSQWVKDTLKLVLEQVVGIRHWWDHFEIKGYWRQYAHLLRVNWQWHAIAVELIRECWTEYKDKNEWVLSHFTDAVNLRLSNEINTANLQSFTALQRLSLKNSTIEDATLMHLTTLTRLEFLGDSKINGSSFSALVALTSLHIQYDHVEPCHLSRLTQLTELRLRKCKRVSDHHLRPLTNLSSFSLVGSRSVTDAILLSLTGLCSLGLADCPQITEAAVRRLTNLTSLHLGRPCHITGETLLALPRLNHLFLFNDGLVTNDQLSRLSALSDLEVSYGGPLTAACLPRQLQRLKLAEAHTIRKRHIDALCRSDPTRTVPVVEWL